MASLKSPFGLADRLRRPEGGADAYAIATVLISALMLTVLVGSRFVFSPGITVGLEQGEIPTLTLPKVEMGRLPGAATGETLVVLALKQDDMAIWQGRIRTLEELAADFSPKPGRVAEPRGTLLLKADAAVSMGTFLRVVAMARAAGYASVQIAAEEQS